MDLGSANWYSSKELGDSNGWKFLISLRDSSGFLAKLEPICKHSLGIKFELFILILYNLNIVFIVNKLGGDLIKVCNVSLFSELRICNAGIIRFKIFDCNCVLLLNIIHLFNKFQWID